MNNFTKKSLRNFRPRSAAPTSASGVLEKTLGAYRLDKKLNEYAVFPHWEEIVGEEIARVAAPEKLSRSRILLVRVLDAAWAQELAMRKSELLDRLFACGLAAHVEDIKFITGNPKSLPAR